ncbi:MAG: imidazole glycerol phosphate synthase subunit HisH [Rickettsiales bacterium]|nr:imidazole glycerol phosphate synthase subunit HisH [Rickettsiales bacterium]
MRIALIDYSAGNLHSAAAALRRVAPEADLCITSQASDLRDATHIVLPGVGAFADCMRGLRAVPDMIEALEQRVHVAGVPFLGICVGMQMLFERGLEHGTHAGLGWLKGEVRRMEASGLKVPHMGWNTLQRTQPSHPLLHGIVDEAHAYFVHSYHAVCDDEADCLATTDYGQPLVAIVGRDHIFGTQFHPEKSQGVGHVLLHNFLGLS